MHELEQVRPPRTAQAPFDAVLEGETVHVTAVLDLTAVYHTSSDPTQKRLASHARFVVDRTQVPTRDLPYDPRTDAATHGDSGETMGAATEAAAVNQSVPEPDTVPTTARRPRQPTTLSHSGKDLRTAHLRRIDELRGEVVRLRPFATIGERVVSYFRLEGDRRPPVVDLVRELALLAGPLVESGASPIEATAAS